MKRIGVLTCVSVVFLVGMGQQVDALTIYRIGGESLPRPEIDADFEFVQLSWSESEEARHGRMELLDVDPDFIKPKIPTPPTWATAISPPMHLRRST